MSERSSNLQTMRKRHEREQQNAEHSLSILQSCDQAPVCSIISKISLIKRSYHKDIVKIKEIRGNIENY